MLPGSSQTRWPGMVLYISGACPRYARLASNISPSTSIPISFISSLIVLTCVDLYCYFIGKDNVMKTYNASGDRHTSSNGFVNYLTCTPEGIVAALSEVYEDFLNVVVLDGDDDWYGKAIYKPGRIAREAKIEVLGYFHTGVSGMSCTGIIINSKDLGEFMRVRGEMLGIPEHNKGSHFLGGITVYNHLGPMSRLV